MGRILIMGTIALLLLDAAILGNLGSLLGAIIDPANMVDTSNGQGSGANIPTASSTPSIIGNSSNV